jgi:hypothetical protein
VDGAQVTKTSRSSQLGGAILGGILAGGVGAIIGGLSATQETTTDVKQIDLNIIVNDTSSPQLMITMFKSGINSPVDKKPAMDNARHWHNLISILIHQADLEDEKQENYQGSQTSAGGNLSIAVEIEKLGSLLEKGLLTREEFEQQKNNLLR